MINTHLLVPTEISKKLSERFHVYAQNGHFGYFVDLTEPEFYGLIRSLITQGYRVDLKPLRHSIRMMARKELD